MDGNRCAEKLEPILQARGLLVDLHSNSPASKVFILSQSKPESFADVDWDGDIARPIEPLSKIHPYPARFIPLIPDELIKRYVRPGMTVLDPFCGSGTTLVSALRAKCSAVGIDLHPIACLISRVKTRQYHHADLEAIESAAALPIRRKSSKTNALPEIPKVDYWFSHEVQLALRDILASVELQSTIITREALLCAISRIIVRVSRQESDTRYAAVDNNISYDNVLHHYQRSVSELCESLRRGHLVSDTSVAVLNRDILSVEPKEILRKIDIVITSPPYPNAYEYWLYHKYRMYWLGFDPLLVRKHEIGARPHYFRKNYQTADDFERQMIQLFELLKAITTPDAPLCFVISDSIIRGDHIDNRALMARAASFHGYHVVESIVRNIPASRKSFNPRVSPRNREHVLVFRAQK